MSGQRRYAAGDELSSLPVFDFDVIREITEAAGITTTELIGLFLGELDGKLPRLNAAIDAGDGKTVEWLAHSLKSSAANVGAMRIALLARWIEAVAMMDGGAVQQAAILLAEELDHYRREVQA